MSSQTQQQSQAGNGGSDGDNGGGDVEYSWEQNAEPSWDLLHEDEGGVLSKRRKASAASARGTGISADVNAAIHRGLIRYVYLVLDVSHAMSESDMRPSRLEVAIAALNDLINNFFDENPLSNLGILISRDGKAAQLSALSGSPQQHLRALEDLKPQGQFSLQNSLGLALGALKSAPPYGTKECIFVMAAISTTDPGDVFDTIDQAKSAGVRCSVISLSAEVHVAKVLVENTKGVYSVARSKNHFHDLLMAVVQPPPKEGSGDTFTAVRANFITMGFPSQTPDSAPSNAATATPGGMARHASRSSGAARQVLCVNTVELSSTAYYCPQCRAACTEVPSTCKICQLPLIKAPHLARSYHHLFPVAGFLQVTSDQLSENKAVDENNDDNANGVSEVPHRCFACQEVLGVGDKGTGGGVGGVCLVDESVGSQCSSCDHLFCLTCDVFVHHTLHNCPGCLQMAQQ